MRFLYVRERFSSMALPLVLLVTLYSVCLDLSAQVSNAQDFSLELQGVQKIWDAGEHNAFTDLVWYKDRFYCVFREASGHVSPDGAVRVLSSPDGNQWESFALLTHEGYDLRDPKIVVCPDGENLAIYGGAAVREGKDPATQSQSFVSFSKDGKTWTKPEWVYEKDQWLWRVTWFGGKAYGISYGVAPELRSKKQYGTRLVCSEDGKTFTALVPDLFHEHGPTEATLRFAEDGTCYCLQRRDGKQLNTALLGSAKPPYQEWQWKDLGRYFGGPDFIQIPNKQWIAAGRFHTDDGSKTVLCKLDVDKGELVHLLTLPSGGDTSYPGLVVRDGVLWVSYYASHEGKTSIYIAKAAIK